MTCPIVGNNISKEMLIPHEFCVVGHRRNALLMQVRGVAIGGVCGGLASWWGKSLPRRRSVAGLRGRPATLGLRYGPDSYGRQQWGILDNGRKPDPAMPRAGRRPSGCKPLLFGKKE